MGTSVHAASTGSFGYMEERGLDTNWLIISNDIVVYPTSTEQKPHKSIPPIRPGKTFLWIRNSYKFTTFIPGLKTVQTCACALVHNSAIILFHYAQSTAGNTFWMQLFLMLDINETPAQATAGQLLDPQFGIIGVTQHWQGHKWDQNLACAVPLQSYLGAELRFTGENVHVSAKPISLLNLGLHMFADSLHEQ